MGKLFACIVLEEQQDSILTDLLQFGFYKNFHCWKYIIVKRNNEYYNENNTDYYLLLLDASKAFDLVEYEIIQYSTRSKNVSISAAFINEHVHQ